MLLPAEAARSPALAEPALAEPALARRLGEVADARRRLARDLLTGDPAPVVAARGA